MTFLRPRLGRAQLTTALAVLAMVAMVVLAVTKINIAAASTALSHASLLWVLIAAGSVAAATCARGESWFAALRSALPGTRLSRATVTRSLMIGMAASTVAPARVGEGVRTWLVSRRTRQGCTAVLGTVVAQTLLNLLALALLAIVVLTSSRTTKGLHLATIAITVAIPILLLVTFIGLARLLRTLWPGHPHRARVSAVQKLGRWLSRQLDGTGQGMAVFSSPRALVHATVAQLGAWMLQWFACYAVMLGLGFGHHASPAAAAACLLAINLTAAVPVTPGNVGVFQAACIALLTPLGVGAGHALAYGLLLQGIEITVALALAIPAALHEGVTLSTLSRAAGERRFRQRLALAQ